MKINPTTFPFIETNSLLLRPLDISDAEALLKLRSDEQVNRYLNRPTTNTRADAEAFIEKIAAVLSNKQGAYWAICLKDTPTELIGTICYWGLDIEKETAQIGYELMAAQQGKGFMQEAIAAVISYGFNKMQLNVIIAETHPDNTGSSKLLMKNGFTLDTRNEFVSEEDADGQQVYVLCR